MRIGLVIESLVLGGAERAMTLLAGELARRGHTVSLITLSPPQSDFFTLAPGVERVDLSEPRWSGRDPSAILVRNLRRIARLRRELTSRRLQAAISFMDASSALAALASLGTGIPVIICQQTVPQHRIPGYGVAARRLTAPLASRLVVLSKGVVPWAERLMVRRGAVRVIPNPIQPPLPGARPTKSSGGRQMLAMGRLDPSKGFDMLIEAFARIVPEYPAWKLTILGEGQERPALEKQIDALGLKARITLPGAVQNPYDVMRQTDLFVLSSRYEGFSNALAEAMACGLPVISFDCPTGPRDIIRHEVDGLLIPPEDVVALAAAMARLMSDAGLRRRLAARAPEVLDRFGVDRVVDLWESLLQEVQQKRPAR